jgi:quercetin dioxygenase-like cupin family protein
MAQFTRRSLLVGLGSVAVFVGEACRALAQQQDRVQRGDAKTFPSMIPGVAQIRVREVTYQPGGRTSAPMPHSMVCECKVGALEVSQDGMTKTMNTGDMWTCHKGMVETVENKGTQPAVMRVIELVPA